MLILASASPRRRDLLAAAGVACVVDAADIDETPRPNEAASAYAERLAREKAAVVAARHPDCSVLGADTVVVVDGEIFGKPIDADDARRMLRRLSGRAHVVMTAVAVACNTDIRSSVENAVVEMRTISENELHAYVQSGEPMDKAGAYAIQGGAGTFICRVSGDMDTIVGLPVKLALKLLNS
ncbi:MAG: septum formation inhibitor Maf [Acidobacteria bacterium]|jgi:septum formation protein|nr:septum formation inhibitor Maf [Acidobacteriota bacterium]